MLADKEEGGEHAARSVEKWLRQWGIDGAPQEAPIESKTKGRATPAPAKKNPSAKPTEARRRVYNIHDPNVHGTVIVVGEQVSEVKWDVAVPWGKTSFESNTDLRDVDEAIVKAEQTFRRAKAFRVMRKDTVVGTYKKFAKASEAAGDDDTLWVFAVTSGGGVVLLMRPQWGVYLRLEAEQ